MQYAFVNFNIIKDVGDATASASIMRRLSWPNIEQTNNIVKEWWKITEKFFIGNIEHFDDAIHIERWWKTSRILDEVFKTLSEAS